MTALSIDVHITNRMQNYYQCNSNMDIWQMNFNISKCCSIHFIQATMHKMENTYYLRYTLLLSSDHFKYLGVTLQSNLRYDRHIQDIANSQSQSHPRITAKKCIKLITSIERMCILAFSPSPARICLYSMVLLAKIPCGCYWESPVPFCPLHIQWLPFWLHCVHYDQKHPLGFLRSTKN